MKQRNKADWFEIEQLAPNLYGIGEFGHLEEVLSFLLVGEQQGILLDTGLGLYSIREQVEKITDRPIIVINSHAHFDHIGNNAEFETVMAFDHIYNRERAAHGASADYLQKWTTADMFWGKRPTPMPDPYEILPYPYATYFKAGKQLAIPPFEIEILHTPGHSDDSISIFERNNGWLFAFDLLYDGPIYIESNGGLAKYRQSLHKIAALNGVTQIFGSHNAYRFSRAHFDAIKSAIDAVETAELVDDIIIDGRLRLEPT